MRNFEDLTKDEMIEIEGGGFFYDLGRAVGEVADFLHGVVDGIAGKEC